MTSVTIPGSRLYIYSQPWRIVSLATENIYPGVLFSIIGVDPDPFLLDNQRKMREGGCVIHVEMLKGVTCAVNCDV